MESSDLFRARRDNRLNLAELLFRPLEMQPLALISNHQGTRFMPLELSPTNLDYYQPLNEPGGANVELSNNGRQPNGE